MATVEEMESALRNADAAGDTAVAQRIARALDEQRSQHQIGLTAPGFKHADNVQQRLDDPNRPVGSAPSVETGGSAKTPEQLKEQFGSEGPSGPNLLDVGMDQVAFGFGDEIRAAVSAANAHLKSQFPDYDGPPVDLTEAYTEFHKSYNQMKEDGRTDKPFLTGAAEFAGMLLGGGGVAAQAFKLFPKAAGAFGKALKVAGIGGAESALFGAGNAETGDRLEPALKEGAAGAVISPVLARYASKIEKWRLNKNVDRALKQTEMTQQQIEKGSKTVFKEIDSAGIMVNERGKGEIAQKINSAVKMEGLELSKKLHPKTLATLTMLDKRLNSGNPITWSTLDMMHHAINQTRMTAKGMDKALLGRLQKSVDDFIVGLDNTKMIQLGNNKLPSKEISKKLFQARELWMRKSKLTELEQAIKVGLDHKNGPDKGIRTELNKLVIKINNGKIKNWSTAEKDALLAVVKGGHLANFGSVLEQFSFGGARILFPVSMAVAVGAKFGTGAGIAAPFVAATGGPLAERMTKGAVNKAHRLVGSGENAEQITRNYILEGGDNYKYLGNLLLNSKQSVAAIDPNNFKGKNRELVANAIAVALTTPMAGPVVEQAQDPQGITGRLQSLINSGTTQNKSPDNVPQPLTGMQ